ncbi:MAG: pyridoxal phosphate-dependent aminotransferase [Proteobacteria bacterium]|nr:pyridoxal phosphate-dependent aminotransferase [Pseudomonadota bacterium]MCL2308234.1 pyridoxal phosphate-dependent aminotransferase [Pseudomonadota bacterium]
MKYDFDTVVERQGTNALKYDFARERGKPDGLLPLWVADMDFPAPPEVLADIHKSVHHGIFGYTEVKNDYYEAVIRWFDSRFGYRVSANEILKAPGVVFALVQAIRAYTQPGDAVMIQTPVYHPFYEIIRDNGRTLVTNPLVYRDGKYFIDFEDFERKIIEHDVKMFILCSPHNPVGRVWTRSELATMNEMCERRGVLVVSDEIHCDFVWRGYTHTCFGLLNENAVIATAPSKTFNLAGLQTSHLFVKNAELRRKLKTEIGRSGYSQLNTLGLVASQSAYTKGGDWLEALNGYLAENIRFTREFLATRLPKIRLVEPEGTYLLWLDFSDYALTQKELDRRVTEDARLWLSSGTGFGQDGEGFQRINTACPRATLTEALRRLEKVFG